MIRFFSFAILLGSLCFAVGCKNFQKLSPFSQGKKEASESVADKQSEVPVDSVSVTEQPSSVNVVPAKVENSPAEIQKSMDKESSAADKIMMPTERTVYFDYDKFTVREDFRSMLMAHTKYLMGNKSANIRIEGYADNRGSKEYNLALGERRAYAVKKTLHILGATESQMETVSYGEEKAENCSDEACFVKDRKAEIRYTSAGE